jgi:hypothetical protein
MTGRSARAYAYAFFRLRNCARALSNDGLHDWKALLVISVVQIYVLLDAAFLSEVILRRRLFPSNWSVVVVPLAFGLVAANYFALLYEERWRRYEDEFRSYSAKARRVGAIVIIAVIVLVLLSLVVTFYAMSRVEWVRTI